MFDKEKISGERLSKFLEKLKEKYEGKFSIVDFDKELIRVLVPKGFIEIRKDIPFILIGHFTKVRHARGFKRILHEILDEFEGSKLGIFTTKEKASIIRVFRAWRRERKSKKEIRKLVGKK